MSRMHAKFGLNNTPEEDVLLVRGNRILVVLAHGFGLGLLKPAPGTWGSLLGLPLAWGLAQLSLPIAAVLWLGLFLLGVAACGAAAQSFNQKDPGQCVIDEYVALPLVTFLFPTSLRTLMLAFVLFRIFDIWKPPPIRQIERIPGGWGVMADDVVAAAYAAGVLWLVLMWLD